MALVSALALSVGVRQSAHRLASLPVQAGSSLSFFEALTFEVRLNSRQRAEAMPPNVSARWELGLIRLYAPTVIL